MPFRSVFVSFLQLAQVWLLSCLYFDFFCHREGLQVLWDHCLFITFPAVLATLQRPAKPRSSASFLKPDNHTFSTSKSHHVTSAGWHKWTLTHEIIHSMAFSIWRNKGSHMLTLVGFSSLQRPFPYVNLIWFLEWFMRCMYFFLILQMTNLRFREESAMTEVTRPGIGGAGTWIQAPKY